MLQKSFKFQTELATITDACMVCVAMLAALITHKILAMLSPDTFAVFDMFWSNAWLYIAVIPIWGIALDICGVYDQFTGIKHRQAFTRAAKGGILAFAILLGALYVLRIHTVPRTLLIIHCLYGIVLVYLRMVYLQPLLLRVEPRRRLLLAGNADSCRTFFDWFKAPERKAFYEVIGVIVPDPANADGLPVLGETKDFSSILHDHYVNAVVILPTGLPAEAPRNWLQQCETEGIETWLLPDYLHTAIASATLDELAGQPMIVFSTTPKSLWGLGIKRLMDITLSGLGLVFLSPVYLGIALAIRRGSPGPAFFSQCRCTLNGRRFNMYKFRTMVQNAEDIRGELEAQNEVSGPVFKIKDDPRITPIGRILRRYSLDELPQLWNVFKGDMSIVGPRPPIPAEVAKYESWQRRRLSMRGGCTCLWQVGGRNQLDFEDWMRLDLQYIDTWSLSLDCIIILKTIRCMIKGTGY